ncbi:transcription termination factor Rho [PVC group bacterium]|nr:transcription termination factor Rho [PVC group bacterium]
MKRYPHYHNYNKHRRDHRPHQPPRRIDEAEKKFLAGTAVDPAPRICLEKGSADLTVRIVDIITPIGMGQRGLIVSPPGAGKTTLIKNLCQAVTKSNPEIKLYCLLVDERPEEVTDFRRSVEAEVHWSTSDNTYEQHVQTADKLMKEAIREASEEKDVMVFIDSLTRLSRVHNAERASSGKTLSGGVDSRAMEVPRRMFGAARNIENGGSLTILATILVDTGSRMDQVIFEEFKGTGNMELVLSRELSQKRIFPAIDIAKSGTRKEELLLDSDELEKIRKLRRSLLDMGGNANAIKSLIEQLEKYPTNKEFLELFKSE